MDVAELTARQLQWVVGANPFSRSLLFGVGYDYWQNFTVDNINFVGGLGLGMNSYEADMPAWPNNAVFPYKEQWSYSTGRMALNLAQCATPALLLGHASSPLTLREQRSGAVVSLQHGKLNQPLVPGRYMVNQDSVEWQLDLVGGRTYRLNFDPQHTLALSLLTDVAERHVVIHADVLGSGAHDLALRSFNLVGNSVEQHVVLRQGQPNRVSWRLTVIDMNKPWIAVVVPGFAPDLRQEVFGRMGTFPQVC